MRGSATDPLPTPQTSFGGRNRKCAEAFVRSPEKSFEQLEEELLNGQRLQGVITAEEIFDFLQARNALEDFPLFERVYRICEREIEPKELFEAL
ncbi:hypothetical protein JCM10908_006415 [Rhodotorula pacifica]|uniref:uncharacterized protein n=1 Tax=Rhodotorula pacifica TaxID=1495444 RepID=UPI00316C0CAF